VVGVALAGGIAGLSLRAIAEAAGTSHRTLIHHFGSFTAARHRAGGTGKQKGFSRTPGVVPW
jgi:AcrR family transcriptional regulator